MCGLLGGVFRRPVTPADEAVFRGAIGVLAHRGPDDEAVSVVPEANAILAFRRLAIIDLAAGKQPMSTGAGQHIVFNGEIYNFAEVRPGLVNAGVPLRTRSDSEVLLWQLTREGTAGLAPLAGMFAFGFVDAVKKKLIVGRDRLGVKQLYYTETPEGFFFASEPKALLQLPWVSRELAREQLRTYFTFRTVPAPATLIRGIHKLPAAHVIEYDLTRHTHTTKRYWHYQDAGRREDERVLLGEVLDRFEAGFDRAIRRRLVSDVPVGAFLSGGLDSSLVVAAMRRIGHPDICTFSATFPGSRDDESTFARRVSQRFRTRHLEHPTDAGSVLGQLEGWVDLNDDLVADASCLPLLSVSQLARRNGYIVMLSGEGSDELFGGYGSYHKYVLLHSMNRAVPGARVRSGLLDAATGMGLVSPQDLPRVREYFVEGGHFMGTAALLGAPELNGLIQQNGHAFAAAPRARGHGLNDLCEFDFIARIPDDLMVRTDRATMGASIEARVPFLDHHLVELVMSLPASVRSLPGFSKVLPRLLAARWGVPYQTIVHRKIGFQLPMGRWFRNELRPLWLNILDERRLPGINYDYVAQVFDAHDRGTGHFEEILWRVAALELWYRRWIRNEPVGELINGRAVERVAVAVA